MMDFKESLKPHCAICNKEVDDIEWMQDFFTLTVYAKAHCHGETETSFLTQEMVMNATISKGTAFMNKKLDNDKAFDKQVEPQIGLTVEKYTEAKYTLFNKEQELFYRATDYRGS